MPPDPPSSETLAPLHSSSPREPTRISHNVAIHTAGDTSPRRLTSRAKAQAIKPNAKSSAREPDILFSDISAVATYGRAKDYFLAWNSHPQTRHQGLSSEDPAREEAYAKG